LGNYDLLLENIIEGIKEKKGKEIVNIDLRKLQYSACDNFIICHGDSGTQVKALAESVEIKVMDNLTIHVRHREGMENASWILLDYGAAVVHIFQKEARAFYKLEDLWGDADITMFNDD
jgi:ribosome-associated protein